MFLFYLNLLGLTAAALADAIQLPKWTEVPLQMTGVGRQMWSPEPERTRITDLVPADVRAMVPDHWHQFPPVSPLCHYALGIACALICESGLPPRLQSPLQSAHTKFRWFYYLIR